MVRVNGSVRRPYVPLIRLKVTVVPFGTVPGAKLILLSFRLSLVK
ncbi:hypothetical protein [Methanobacterium sp. SMA-27]|nr:hypothetical protein [Methanobacterium sp. SMA-27]